MRSVARWSVVLISVPAGFALLEIYTRVFEADGQNFDIEMWRYARDLKRVSDERLMAAGAKFEVVAEAELIGATAAALTEGSGVGWFQGRMEFGPRVLGGRFILGGPRSPTMQMLLNLKVKYRESFRPRLSNVF